MGRVCLARPPAVSVAGGRSCSLVRAAACLYRRAFARRSSVLGGGGRSRLAWQPPDWWPPPDRQTGGRGRSRTPADKNGRHYWEGVSGDDCCRQAARRPGRAVASHTCVGGLAHYHTIWPVSEPVSRRCRIGSGQGLPSQEPPSYGAAGSGQPPPAPRRPAGQPPPAPLCPPLC